MCEVYAILRFMNSHSDDLYIQKVVLKDLLNFLHNDDHSEKVLEQGGARSIVYTMLSHSDSLEIQNIAIQCLISLSRGIPERNEWIVKTKCIPTIVKTLACFPYNIQIQNSGIVALLLICEDTSKHLELLLMDGPNEIRDILLRILKIFIFNSTLHNNAMNLLLKIAKYSKEEEEYLIKQGIVESVIQVLRQWSDPDEMQKYGFSLLNYLSQNHPEIEQQITDLGLHEYKVWKEHQNESSVVCILSVNS